MRAIVVTTPGDADVLAWQEVPDPVAAPGEVIVDVAAAAVNRADVLQRQGLYPPPPGAPEWLGLECSGTVAELGPGVTSLSIGDEVCCLLSGGGYAERVAVPAGQAMPIPPGVDLITAAGLPEVACTVWSNLVMVAHLQRGDWLLVHGGGSGIGTMAIQVARALGARVAVTAGSAEKLETCKKYGADILINYKEQDFADVIKAEGGADVILDIIGAKYLDANVSSLAKDGHMVIIGMQGGTRAELDINALLRKRGAVIATSLRARPVEGKSAICAGVVEHVWPLVADGAVRPIVHTTMPLAEARAAHELMESGSHTGKLLLTL